MGKYEPTNYDKRRIMLNDELERSYQEIRKDFNDKMFGELTPEEQAQWEAYQARKQQLKHNPK